jgi:transcriptional regulator with XRE-family HTH domain
MDETTTGLASAIGERVRTERLSRHWTLDQLAEAAEVSRRMLIKVEQGSANPSVGTLLRISAALGVGLPYLVDAPEPKPVRVTRSGQGAVLWNGEHGGRGVLVASTEPPDVVELWDWVLGPGDQHSSEAHTTGTKELVHVVEGQLTVEVANEIINLNTGDAAAFPGDSRHSYSNTARRAARFSLSVFDPNMSSSFGRETVDG